VSYIQSGFSWVSRAAVIQRGKVPKEKAHGRKKKSKCTKSIKLGLPFTFFHNLLKNI